MRKRPLLPQKLIITHSAACRPSPCWWGSQYRQTVTNTGVWGQQLRWDHACASTPHRTLGSRAPGRCDRSMISPRGCSQTRAAAAANAAPYIAPSLARVVARIVAAHSSLYRCRLACRVHSHAAVWFKLRHVCGASRRKRRQALRVRYDTTHHALQTSQPYLHTSHSPHVLLASVFAGSRRRANARPL